MMPVRKFWCPNVMLLDPNNLAAFPTEELVTIIRSLPKELNFLFVVIDASEKAILDSQIVIEQPEYSIYRENKPNRGTISSAVFEAGIPYVYYIFAEEEYTKMAFIHFIDILGFDYPIVCLASKIAHFLQPAVFVIPDLQTAPESIKTQEIVSKSITFFDKKLLIFDKC